MSLVRFGVEKPVPINLLMIAIILGGVLAALQIRRQFFPEVDADTVTVSLPYPGATPEEIEETLAIKVEDSLTDLDEVKNLYTTVSEGGGSSPNESLPEHGTHFSRGGHPPFRAAARRMGPLRSSRLNRFQ